MQRNIQLWWYLLTSFINEILTEISSVPFQAVRKTAKDMGVHWAVTVVPHQSKTVPEQPAL